METREDIEGIILHSPKMPLFKDYLKRYMPKVWIIQHPVFNRVAKFLRNTDKIALSEALGITTLANRHQHVIFDHNSIHDYLNRTPRRLNKSTPILVIGGKYDNVVPHEHTEKIASVLKRRNFSIDYKILDCNHFLIKNQPQILAEEVANFIGINHEEDKKNERKELYWVGKS